MSGAPPPSVLAQFATDGASRQNGLRIPFFSESFGRAYGFPETRLENMFSESTPLREERPYTPFVGLREIRYSRPGLAPYLNIGTGPIRGLSAGPRALVRLFFMVSGNTIYDQDGLARGTIPGTDLVRFAFSSSQMVAVSSGTPYLYDPIAGVFKPLINSNIPLVSDVAYLAGRFVYSLQSSDRFYWSEINDAANVGGLNFATAESAPDPIIAMATLNDELVLFGTTTVEFWGYGGTDAFGVTTPFAPVVGRGYQRGCVARDAVVFTDNAQFWVSNTGVVYRSANAPERLSSHSIEGKIRACANPAMMSAWVAFFDGHEFYVLNIPGQGTFGLDVSRPGERGTGEWDAWTSYGRTQFRGRVALSSGGLTFVGDDTTNDLGLLSPGYYKDYNDPLVRVASAFIKVEEGQPRCNALVLHCVTGVGNVIDPGMNPVVEMRWSDDQGRSFVPWRQATLGARGVYFARAVWQRLGTMRAPGRLVEVRVSDPVNATYSHLELNPVRPAY